MKTRPVEEIQKAHDMLVGMMLDLPKGIVDEEAMAALQTQGFTLVNKGN